MVMQDFDVTAICCTPSYLVHLIERAKEAKTCFGRLKVRRLRRRALDRVDAPAHRGGGGHQGATTSTASPRSSARASAIECEARTGRTSSRTTSTRRSSTRRPGAVLPDGAEGELVLTTLSKQAMPMIRYRTRDITALDPEPCACGRTIRAHRAASAAAPTTCSSSAA